MNTTANKLTKLKASQDRCSQLIDKIVADKKYHHRDLLQPILESMDELIQLAEKKLEE